MNMEPWPPSTFAAARSLDPHGLAPAPGLSVVVPCYNEAESLAQLVHRVTAACTACVGDDFELVLINDGSRDRTWTIMNALAQRHPQLVLVNLAGNYGHQLALSAGLQVCRGEAILVMDADLQDPPELLPDFLARLAEGHDVVYGQRVTRAGETMFKRATASLFYRTMQRMVDVPIPCDTGDFRIMTRRVVDHLNAMPERYRFIRGMVSLIGFSQVALPYEREARFAGQSKYPLRKMLAFAFDAITSFSTVPLRLSTYLGFIAGALGAVTLGWVFACYLLGRTLAGWTSLAGIVLIIGSLQLVMLGIFGEYLGRMYMESKRRPLFIIDEIRVASPAMVCAPMVVPGNDKQATERAA